MGARRCIAYRAPVHGASKLTTSSSTSSGSSLSTRRRQRSAEISPNDDADAERRTAVSRIGSHREAQGEGQRKGDQPRGRAMTRVSGEATTLRRATWTSTPDPHRRCQKARLHDPRIALRLHILLSSPPYAVPGEVSTVKPPPAVAGKQGSHRFLLQSSRRLNGEEVILRGRKHSPSGRGREVRRSPTGASPDAPEVRPMRKVAARPAHALAKKSRATPRGRGDQLPERLPLGMIQRLVVRDVTSRTWTAGWRGHHQPGLGFKPHPIASDQFCAAWVSATKELGAASLSLRAGPAGSCNTVARCPGFRFVTITMRPLGNSSASWCA